MNFATNKKRIVQVCRENLHVFASNDFLWFQHFYMTSFSFMRHSIKRHHLSLSINSSAVFNMPTVNLKLIT